MTAREKAAQRAAEKAEEMQKLEREEERILVWWILKLIVALIAILIIEWLPVVNLATMLGELLIAVMTVADGGKREEEISSINIQLFFLSR